ncbi:MAG TPA: NIPSNAP family protein [Chloroflexota bacterium]
MRTYDLLPGQAPEYAKHFAEALPHRTKISPLGAFFQTEIGPLNRVIHMWPYESLADRDRIRAEANATGHWPPHGEDLLVTQESKMLTPAPFSPPLREAKLGEIYEIRTYTIKPGEMQNVVKAWEVGIEERVKFSPLAFAGFTTIGGLNQWVHIWPYADMNERARIRAEANKSGKWPPPTRPYLLKQENCIAVPASFSPLH